MKNENTVLYQLTETSRYMMGFVIVTKENNVIVIDGGRPQDMPLLKSYIDGRHISAWILTHPHDDHISGLVDELKKNGGEDLDIQRIYYRFPPYEWLDKTDVINYPYFREEVNEMLPAFREVFPLIEDKVVLVNRGDVFFIDEVKIEILMTYTEGLYANPINDSSIVFKLYTPSTSVLFLGDIGPDAGDVLYRTAKDKLKSDVVQMAHHGHMNPGYEVYAEISPKKCLWCCPDWLYDEPIAQNNLADRVRLRSIGRGRMYGTTLTRKWMEILGVTEHYVTKDGTNRLVL